MSYVDRIDLSIPSEEITSILSLFASAQEKLELLPQVGPQERKHLAKLGLKNEALALQIIEVGRLYPDLIPRGIDFELIDRDRVAREQLRALKLVLERLLGRVTDAMLLTGVDLYAAALSIYHCLRRNADSASLKENVAELKRGFSRPSRKKKEKPEEPVAVSVRAPEPVTEANQVIQRQNQSEGIQRRDAAATLRGQSSTCNPPQPQPVTPKVTQVEPPTLETARIVPPRHIPLSPLSTAPQKPEGGTSHHFAFYELPTLFLSQGIEPRVVSISRGSPCMVVLRIQS